MYCFASIVDASTSSFRSTQNRIIGANGNGGRPVKNLTLVSTVSVIDENAQSATTALRRGLPAAYWRMSAPPIEAPKMPMRSGSTSARPSRY